MFFVKNKMAGGGLGTTLLRDVGDQERGAGLKGKSSEGRLGAPWQGFSD